MIEYIVYMYEWTIKWMNEWMNEWMNIQVLVRNAEQELLPGIISSVEGEGGFSVLLRTPDNKAELLFIDKLLGDP